MTARETDRVRREECEAVVVRLGDHRWTIVSDYGRGSGKTGYWAEDLAGGYGVGDTLDGALSWCARPVVYRTRKAAVESVAAYEGTIDA